MPTKDIVTPKHGIPILTEPKNVVTASLAMLGFEATDKVTGFEGVITSVTFDLYGCVQALMTPAATKDGKYGDSLWIDTKRLLITGDAPVMNVPDFARMPNGVEVGPSDKPSAAPNTYWR